MDGVENLKVRDRVELSLDGRQIASIVVGALVLVGVVFVLGLNIVRQLAARQLESSRGDALAALDQPPPTAAIPSDALTFHDRLTKDRVPPMDPAPAAAPPPAAVPAAGGPDPATVATPAPAATPPRADKAGSQQEQLARPTYSVQVVATSSRAEADRLVARLKEYAPRVEEAEVPGKGSLYRVRLGAFASKPEADRFLKGFTGKTGSRGLVVASR